MSEELEGRVAIVTGGSKGIGRAIAERLAAAGASVVIAARSIDAPADDLAGTAQEVVALIESRGGRAAAVACDVESEASRAALFAEVIARYGRIDILVNNAGRAVLEPASDYAQATIRSQTEQYLFAPLHLSMLAAEQMKAQGQGWIVNLGSTSAPPVTGSLEENAPQNGLALYAALKSAVHRLSSGLAIEWLGDNIAVNVVAPVGAIATPGVHSLGIVTPEMAHHFEPIEHIAEATLALVSKPPREQSGVIAYSFEYLDQIGRSTMTLDGRAVHTERAPSAVSSTI
jgi:NAD(P)-dependent dehydrogenase (short-subunit alcohol dehydrogenase family)